jgi:hypothetical protein
MNAMQKHVLAGGAAVMLLMGLFPPWTKVTHEFARVGGDVSEHTETEQPAGYCFLFDPPEPVKSSDSNGNTYHGSIKIDFNRLLLQWAMVAFVLVAALPYLKDCDKK